MTHQRVHAMLDIGGRDMEASVVSVRSTTAARKARAEWGVADILASIKERRA